MHREVPASIHSGAVELFCTFVSDTAIGMIHILISSASANEIVTFVAALDKLELLCTIISDTGTGVIIPPQGLLQIT